MISQQTKKIIFVLGGPGVGKGTLVQGLIDLLQNKAMGISAGDLLRREIDRLDKGQEPGEMGQIIQNLIKDGKIVPGDITVKLLLQEISSLDQEYIFIDGFPRNKENYLCWKDLQKQYSHLNTSLCIYLDCEQYKKTRDFMAKNLSQSQYQQLVKN